MREGSAKKNSYGESRNGRTNITGVKGDKGCIHVVRAGGMEDDVMLGRMDGARIRGRPRQIWLDKLKGYASGATISNMIRDARDRTG